MRKRLSTALVFATLAAMAITQAAMAMHIQARAILH